MLKVPQLDDLTYEQRVKRAVSRIPAMTDQWTDFNSHDPGITVIQMYAWLTDMLGYYMNATGDVHVEKYLKLLGVKPEPAKAAESFVILENLAEPVNLPKGTGFFAGTIPFELAEDYSYVYNRFSFFIQETDGVGMDLTTFAGSDGDYIEVFSDVFEKSAVAYFGFEKALGEGDCLFVSVKEEAHRNPFDEQFRLGTFCWEYYTEDGWKTLYVEDETCGFLKSGFLKIKKIQEMAEWQHEGSFEKAFYIRCSLKQNQYDCIPQIGKIYVNPMRVVQKATICRQGEILEQMQIGTTNGCAGQEVVFDYPNVYSFSLAMFEHEEYEKEAELWTMVENLEEADYKDQVFSYDREKKCICFGDGIHGMVPIQKKRICVTGLDTSDFEQGNVLVGEITETDFPLPPGVKVYNPVAAQGGRKKENLQEMLKRMEDMLFVQNRMASEADYQNIILDTPGLMLDLVQVIPGYVYGELYRRDRSPNEVIAVVKPYSQSMTPELSEVYRQKILTHIEKYRLLNTKVSIVSPVYVGIEVYGKLMLQIDTKEAREKVQKRIRELIDYQGKEKPFGAMISYGKVFTSLEAMEEVKLVRELALEKNGSAAKKNERGDILCQEDALSFVEQMNIEFY